MDEEDDGGGKQLATGETGSKSSDTRSGMRSIKGEDESTSSDAVAARPKRPPPPPSRGTYPKPKNFAERIMNCLENSVDPALIRWHGDSNLVAINTTALKTSDILDSRFHGIAHGAFMRNLSRWGFRKAPQSETADGLVVYRNALFQKDNPHMLKHMKIDSDASEVFVRHQQGPVASAGLQQATQPSDPLRQQTQQQQRQSMQEMLSHLSHQHIQRQPHPPPVGVSPATISATFLTAAASAERSRHDIMSDIIGLSQQYLDIVPASESPPALRSIKHLLTLVVAIGPDALELLGGLPLQDTAGAAAQVQQLAQGQHGQVPSDTLRLRELLSSIQGIQASQQPPPAVAARQPPEPAIPGIEAVLRRLQLPVGSAEALLEGLQQHHQQDQGLGSDLQRLLAQATGGDAPQHQQQQGLGSDLQRLLAQATGGDAPQHQPQQGLGPDLQRLLAQATGGDAPQHQPQQGLGSDLQRLLAQATAGDAPQHQPQQVLVPDLQRLLAQAMGGDAPQQQPHQGLGSDLQRLLAQATGGDAPQQQPQQGPGPDLQRLPAQTTGGDTPQGLLSHLQQLQQQQQQNQQQIQNQPSPPGNDWMQP